MLKRCRSRKQFHAKELQGYTESAGSHGCSLEEGHTVAHQCHCGVQW